MMLSVASVVFLGLHTAQAGVIPPLYRALRDQGCDPVAAGVDSPVVARVLRNAPFATAGRRFQSADLVALYTADGWYRPSADSVTLDPVDASCVARLKQHETRLRRVECLSPSAERALMSSPEVFAWHARAGLGGLAEDGAPKAIPDDPGVDLCAGTRPTDEGTWRVRRWSVDLGSASSAQAVRDLMRFEPAMGPAISKTDAARLDPEAWLARGLVRTMKVEVSGEDIEVSGDEAESYEFGITRRCVGPGAWMSAAWVCGGFSVP